MFRKLLKRLNLAYQKANEKMLVQTQKQTCELFGSSSIRFISTTGKPVCATSS
ncbi:MAG: hypothetical protein HOD85_13550 [Deltaproteobacteria bacterium]|nr:hypothetical protein [Deltaproteobacteria bacterium]